MKAQKRSTPWVAFAAFVLLCCAGGCSRTPPIDEAAAPSAVEHDREQEEQEEPKESEKPQTVAEASEGVKAEDPEEVLQGIEQLADFLEHGDETLSAEAGEVLANAAKTAQGPMARGAAIGALAAKADEYSAALIAAIDDPDGTVRDAAIGALARSSPGSAGEAKLQELTASDDPDIKAAAVKALTALREGAGANEMVALASQLGDADGDASAQAAIALKLKGAEALPVLEGVVRNSISPRQRHAATMCVALICAGENPSQQKFAATVKTTERKEAKPPQANPKGLAILTYAVKDADPMTREVAAQGLGYLGDPRAAAPLARALKDPDTHVRRRAASALITTPAKSVQRQLTAAALNDEDEVVRRFAVEALGWIGDASVTPVVVQASVDDSPEVRRYAAKQLGRIKAPAALQALVKLFKDPDEDVRWAAVQAVSAMRDKRATEYLVAALNDPAPQVSNAAEAGLQKLGIAKRKLPGAD